MSKILLLADAGSTTGFARVSHAIGDRLVRDYGHEIHCLAVNYDGDAGAWDTGMKLYLPNKLITRDVYGTSRFVELMASVLPDVVMMINDPAAIVRHLFKNKYDQEFILARTRPIICYMPIDGTNQPPLWSAIGSIVNKLSPMRGSVDPLFIPVAMSKFGQAFLDSDDMIYHGIDQSFHPATPENPVITSAGDIVTSKDEAKAAFGFTPDQFLVLRVDRNSIRKNFGDTWRALIPVMKRHSNVVAWFHCKAEGDQLEIPSLVSRDPDTADRFYYPAKYDTKNGWSENDLIALYNAADLFVSTSMGEGFGLTLGEAAACEVPIIAQKIASIPEVVGPGGFLLQPERLFAVDSGEDQWLPDVKAFTNAIERLYSDRKLRESLGKAGRAHVLETFDWDHKASQFDALINRVAQMTSEMPIRGDEDAEPEPDPE
jgi:D-inositol-3-phosphate glycosyltransferase